MIRRFVTVLLACSLLVIVGITIFGQFWVFHRRVANGTIYVASNSHLYAFYDASQNPLSKDKPTVK